MIVTRWGGRSLKAARPLAAALAVLLLALLVGPVVDHHFAERQAGHGHLLTSVSEADHTHLYGRAHSHEPSAGEPGGAGILPAHVDGVLWSGLALLLTAGAALAPTLGGLRPVFRAVPAPAGILAEGPPRRPPRS